MILLAFILWKVAKLILIPIQILLFLALLFIAYKLLFSPEGMDKISSGVKNGTIQGMVDKAADSASRFVKKTVSDHVAAHSSSADKPAGGSGQAAGSPDSAAKTPVSEKEAGQAVSEKSASTAESVN